LCPKFGGGVIARPIGPSEIKVPPLLHRDSGLPLQQAHYEEAHSMTPDSYFADQPLPSFLSADKSKQQDVGTIWEAADMSSRVLKMSILAATAALIGLVALEVEHPTIHFPKFTAPLTDMPAAQQDTSPSTPTTQASNDAELPSLIVTGVPTRDDFAAASQPPSQTQTEDNGPSPDVLFMQFQAWAARQNTRAQVEAAPPEQDAPAPIMTEDAPTPALPLQKPRRIKPAQNVQTEIPHIPLPRARLQWGQNARVEGRPTQDQASQNAPPQTLLQSLGWHQ
jgi:hypothetical protein